MGWKQSKFIEKLRSIWGNPKEKRHLYWTNKVLWYLAGIGVFLTFLNFVLLSFSNLPSFEELENPNYDLASIIYDTQDHPFGKYYIENREFTEFQDLSPNVLSALLSIEDERFFNHSGIDFQALFRVAVKSVLLQKESSGGGSTISQQLAKLLFKRSNLSDSSAISRAISLIIIKFKEWITAVRLERNYTKEEIISMYLSKFEFINGAHGIQSAAQIYFGKNQEDLEIQEAATLIGMLKNPALYNPARFADRAKSRRNVVLDQLYRNNEIKRDARDSLKLSDIDLSAFKKSSQSDGLAPYFRSELTKYLRTLLLKPQYHRPEGGVYDIYRDGLKIYTTIDVRYQSLAEQAVWEHMSILQARYLKVWEYKDPLTYEADDYQKALRLESIERRIRETDIYQNKYANQFQDLNSESVNKFGLELNEPTIRRLIQAPESISEIDASVNAKFQKLVVSTLWTKIVQAWTIFQADIKKTFDEEIDAEVFAYNEDQREVIRMTRRDSVIYHLKNLQAGLLALDPHTGEIKAWVGGVNHTHFKYDHVTLRRQVGSTIKPFVYATAMAVQGISPCAQYPDIQYTIAPGDLGFNVDKEWTPANSNGIFTQNPYNLYQGLLYSKNSITVRLVKEMGTVDPIRELLNNVGIDKNGRYPNGRLIVPNVPAICLGAVDLSLLEMAGGYTTFANDGIYSEPNFIRRIEDKNGKVIYQSSAFKRRAINSLYNAVMVDMLRNNTGGGFGMGIKTENGGKTGTTNDFADGWFMGITPDLVCGVWVGGDEKWVRFYTLDDGQGFVMARPIFQKFLKNLESDPSIGFDTQAKFPAPPAGFRDLVDCSKYKRRDAEEERSSTIESKVQFDEFEDDLMDQIPSRTVKKDSLKKNNR